MQGFNGNPPVNVGDEIDVQVEAVGEKGDGIVKVKGFVLFVPSVKQGENIRIRVNKVLSKVGFAEKIGEATGPVGNSREMDANDTPDAQVEEDEQYEDSEDFGEEDDTEESDEDSEDIDDQEKQ